MLRWLLIGAGSILLIMTLLILRSVIRVNRANSSTEGMFDTLGTISVASAQKSEEIILDSHALLAECIGHMTESASYCSNITYRLFHKDQLKGRDYIRGQWRIDYLAPDQFFVSQEFWDEEFGSLATQWVTIGEDHYQWVSLDLNDPGLGGWAKTGTLRNASMNSMLVGKSLLELIRDRTPIATGQYEYSGWRWDPFGGQRRYLVATYDPLENSENLTSIIGTEAAQGDCSVTLELWIDTGARRVEKAVFRVKGKGLDQEPIDSEIQHLFTQFNAAIEIHPPAWVNLEENPEGGLTVINGQQVPILSHYP